MLLKCGVYVYKDDKRINLKKIEIMKWQCLNVVEYAGYKLKLTI